MDSVGHHVALRNVALADMEEYVNQQQFSSYDGTLLWKVTEVARRRTMRSQEDKPPFTARVSIPVAMDTKCVPGCIKTGMAWVEEHICPCFLLSCAVSSTRYSAGHSDRRSP